MKHNIMKGFVYRAKEDIENPMINKNSLFTVIGVKYYEESGEGEVLALTTESNLILFPINILNEKWFEFMGEFDNNEIEDTFKPLIRKMKKGEFVFLSENQR